MIPLQTIRSSAYQNFDVAHIETKSLRYYQNGPFPSEADHFSSPRNKLALRAELNRHVRFPASLEMCWYLLREPRTAKAVRFEPVSSSMLRNAGSLQSARRMLNDHKKKKR